MMIETITLRTTPNTVKKAVAGIRVWLTESSGQGSSDTVEMFHHSPFTGDLLIILRRFDNAVLELSRLGLMIVRFLQQFGSVKHTLWISESDADTSEGNSENHNNS